MTKTEEDRLRVPTWIGTMLTVLALVAGITASWYDNRTDVALLKQENARINQEIAELKAQDTKTVKALQDVEKVLIKVDTTLDFLRVRLGITNGGE